jgi:hypothetical protein
MSDFKLPDIPGQKPSSYDWKAYRAAQVANGEYCSQCGNWRALEGATGFPSRCGPCERADKVDQETDHPKMVRRPDCRHLFDPIGEDNYSFYRDGAHAVTCPQCEAHFSFETHVTYSFTSPAMLRRSAEVK